MSFQIRPVREILVVPALPPALSRLPELGLNLIWSWNHSMRAVFRRLDPAAWKASNHNPVVMLGRVEQATLERAAADPRFLALYRRACEILDAYLGAPARPSDMLVAYFSMEYGLLDCLPIYSGGLGVLSGDHLKAVERRDAAAGGRRPAVSERLSSAEARSRRLAAGTHAGQRFLFAAHHAGERAPDGGELLVSVDAQPASKCS